MRTQRDSSQGMSESKRETLLLMGGRSEIGLEVAVRLCLNRDVVLAARQSSRLENAEQRLLQAGAASVHVMEFDARDIDEKNNVGPVSVINRVNDQFGSIDTAILAFGILGDQKTLEQQPEDVVSLLSVDFTSQAAALTQLTLLMKERGHGHIVAFSSIAGWRVRRANFVYGSAKAGLDGYTSGLSDSLHGSGIHLLTVRPGFVIGRMTEGMKPAPLSTTPRKVAEATIKGLRNHREQIWVPRPLGTLAIIMRLVPRSLWRRLSR